MIGSLFRRALIVAPCRTYKFMASAHGSVPYLAMLAGALVAALAGGLWTLAAMISGADRDSALTYGVLGGLLLDTTWLVYTVIVVGVLWLTGKSYTEIAMEGRPKPEQ